MDNYNNNNNDKSRPTKGMQIPYELYTNMFTCDKDRAQNTVYTTRLSERKSK